ncbi:hypothetical protein Bca4012_095459 [Brassica carinata]
MIGLNLDSRDVLSLFNTLLHTQRCEPETLPLTKKRRRQIFPPNSSENQRQVHEGDSTHMEGTNNGHNRERGPPRTPLMPTAPDSQSLPNVPSMEAVMEELREVTYQYTNCPDPVESAARRQRVPDGEVHSLMEVTTTRIVAAAVEAQQHNQNVSIPQISPAATDRVVNAANSQSVMPAPNVILLPASSAAPTTKRRGRPPKARKHNPSPRLLAGTSSRKHNLAKAHSSPGDLLSLDSSHWIKSKVEEIFPDVAHHIMRIVPSSMGSEDSFIWCGTKSGSYSVKSGYLAIKEHQKSHRPTLTHEETLDWQQFVWSITSSPKLKLFLWKLCRGALPLGANLAARGLTAAKTCPHCGVEETALHLFFQCPFAVQVWMLAPLRAPFDSASCHSLEAGIQEASEVVCVLPTGIVGNLSSWICWFIWTTRNQLVFENRHISALNTLSHALAAAREWQTAQQNGTQVSSGTHTHSVEMITTPPGTVLCNTDASWTLESGAAGLGWLFDYT